ncbi:MAG TPA: TolC family protein, partial [bacterium]|nr:TolC family protein [bacterium]
LFNGIHVALAMPIGTFGRLGTAKRMAEKGVEAARVNEIKATEKVRFQVKQLYYGALLAREMTSLLDDAVRKIGDRVAEEEAKEENRLDPYDILKLKASKVDLERRLAEARQNQELAYEGLRVHMDLEPGTPIELASANLKPELVDLSDESKYIDAGMNSQPDSRLLDIGVETRRHQYRLEKFKLMPTAGFAFFAEVGRTHGYVAGVTADNDYNDPFNYTRAGVGLQLKGTLDFHGAYGRIKKARAEYYKAAYDRMIAKRGLALELKKAYLSARRAKEDVARARKGESIARQMSFMQKINQDMGIGDNQRYGDALMLLLLQRGYYYKAIYDYNISLADLAQKVTLAQYEKLSPVPEGAKEYDVFDADDDEGFETYGIESTAYEETPAGWEPALRLGVERGTSTKSTVDFEPRGEVSSPDSP